MLDLNGAGFAFNEDVRVPRGTMLILSGTWVLDAALDPLIDAVRAELLGGRDGGAWDGATGIRSTDAPLDPTIALDYIESSELFPLGGTFGGEHVDESAILIAHARLGDADLDEHVTLSDSVTSTCRPPTSASAPVRTASSTRTTGRRWPPSCPNPRPPA